MATGTSGGNIVFAGNSSSSGNSYNSISYCDIGPAGSNLPSQCIISTGASNPGNQNSGDTIRNCNIFDYFNATYKAAEFILLIFRVTL
jgi:hypothetical protein